MREAFLIFWVLTASTIGGMFGLAMYLGYRQGRKNQVAVLADTLNLEAANHAEAMRLVQTRHAQQIKEMKNAISKTGSESETHSHEDAGQRLDREA